jgi:hypothetical protein
MLRYLSRYAVFQLKKGNVYGRRNEGRKEYEGMKEKTVNERGGTRSKMLRMGCKKYGTCAV